MRETEGKYALLFMKQKLFGNYQNCIYTKLKTHFFTALISLSTHLSEPASPTGSSNKQSYFLLFSPPNCYV